MPYRVVHKLQSIKVHLNHFMCSSLLTEGFKVSPFFSDDPSLQLNQASKYQICAVWILNEKVCSFHQGVRPCTLLANSKAIFQALSRSYSNFGCQSRENSVQHMIQEFQFPQHLALLALLALLTHEQLLQAVLSAPCNKVESAPCPQFSLLTGSSYHICYKV